MRLLVLLLLFAASARSQSTDSDHDGLSDALENALLQQYAPHLQIAADDCSVRPARLTPGIAVPTVAQEDGTLYGQATPRHVADGSPDVIELHFYHLWRRDCGRMGHPLDAEHVAALLRLTDSSKPAEVKSWRAAYWYAAAHEDTVCDASHLARASTVDAETHGARVWISSGKHGSFLTESMCTHGCGGDRCGRMVDLASPPVVNLGELRAPMSGAVWSSSTQWPGPLSDKMLRSDFPPERTARVDRLLKTDIAWANPAKRPAQAAILGGNSAINGAVVGGDSTGRAISIAGEQSSNALGTAAQSTGHALGKSWHAVRKALGGDDSAATK
ncbi:hypothetical protein Terro_0297 [Terriglobus roseus DSM 18391]|uniref:Uncharacterized protein n=1 Tax=Terriglobus roseus (strain DSM 18391 / NRRL B-41598 / KBS 63) TaxID=926566 RepID=I3ZBM8_TERRK|nr:hypothetical protein [Terriglobus roseus]AFL86646.1 hypothetical protein Terro_0297 [Terriglobus roseus DSM 18391]